MWTKIYIYLTDVNYKDFKIMKLKPVSHLNYPPQKPSLSPAAFSSGPPNTGISATVSSSRCTLISDLLPICPASL